MSFESIARTYAKSPDLASLRTQKPNGLSIGIQTARCECRHLHYLTLPYLAHISYDEIEHRPTCTTPTQQHTTLSLPGQATPHTAVATQRGHQGKNPPFASNRPSTCPGVAYRGVSQATQYCNKCRTMKPDLTSAPPEEQQNSKRQLSLVVSLGPSQRSMRLTDFRRGWGQV